MLDYWGLSFKQAADVLLARLAERPGTVVTRDELLRSPAAGSRQTQLRTVDSHVYRLRRRLQAVDPDGRYIETVHGAGYRLVHPAPAARAAAVPA